MTALPERYKPLAFSLFIHLLILLAMALYAFPQLVQPKWYELSIGDYSRETLPPPQVYSAAPNSGEAAQAAAPAAHLTARENKTSETASTQINETHTATAHPGSSEILETPAPTRPAASARTYNPGKNPLAKNALRSSISGVNSGGGDGSVGITVQGGKVRFSLPPGYKHNLGTGGSVTLQFQVDKFARPIPGTIISDQQTEGRMIEAAKKVLLDGNLSFLGEPSPGVTCIISIEFL